MFDSSHWYTKEGAPFYTIIGAKGNERPVTLADARKIQAVPSVTTVLNVLSKPALETWKVKQGVLAALTLTRGPDETDEEFLERVMVDSRRQAQEAAAEGTRIHDAIECAFTGRHVPKEYRPHVETTLAEIDRLYPDVDDWRAEDSFAHELGYGGKVDLHSPSTGIVIDFKTKDGHPDSWGRLHYDQYIQLAAYQRGLELPTAECANIFVSREPAGGSKGHIWTPEEIDHGWRTFKASLELWQVVKKYVPSVG